MAYTAIPNGKGGYTVRDDETLEHADCNGYTDENGNRVTPEQEAELWFTALDQRKADEYAAANAAPVAQADSAIVAPAPPRAN
jgi:hypothetical protein